MKNVQSITGQDTNMPHPL